MRIVCISDTHGLHDGLEVPDGDLLLHAGDATKHGSLEEVAAFNRFLGELPHPHKVVIAGNHDWAFQKEASLARDLITHATYLEDEEAVVEGLRIWGSPWQPWFYDWAFNLRRGPQLRAVWDRIPEGTDVLLTHGPPRGHGDRTTSGNEEGCSDLLDAVRRVRPRLHVFGHIHEGYGQTREGTTRCVNASVCTVAYRPTNPAIVVELEAVDEAGRRS